MLPALDMYVIYCVSTYIVWLQALTNLDVPFGAGACTLESCRCISDVESIVQR
jgi:hypothetical protein